MKNFLCGWLPTIYVLGMAGPQFAYWHRPVLAGLFFAAGIVMATIMISDVVTARSALNRPAE